MIRLLASHLLIFLTAGLSLQCQLKDSRLRSESIREITQGDHTDSNEIQPMLGSCEVDLERSDWIQDRVFSQLICRHYTSEECQKARGDVVRILSTQPNEILDFITSTNFTILLSPNGLNSQEFMDESGSAPPVTSLHLTKLDKDVLHDLLIGEILFQWQTQNPDYNEEVRKALATGWTKIGTTVDQTWRSMPLIDLISAKMLAEYSCSPRVQKKLIARYGPFLDALKTFHPYLKLTSPKSDLLLGRKGGKGKSQSGSSQSESIFQAKSTSENDRASDPSFPGRSTKISSKDKSDSESMDEFATRSLSVGNISDSMRIILTKLKLTIDPHGQLITKSGKVFPPRKVADVPFLDSKAIEDRLRDPEKAAMIAEAFQSIAGLWIAGLVNKYDKEKAAHKRQESDDSEKDGYLDSEEAQIDDILSLPGALGSLVLQAAPFIGGDIEFVTSKAKLRNSDPLVAELFRKIVVAVSQRLDQQSRGARGTGESKNPRTANKVIVIWEGAGGGHRNSAYAAADILRQADLEVEIIDPAEQDDPLAMVSEGLLNRDTFWNEVV